ncbi:OsmC family protein [Salmonirosea aquatica]|uniref:OsmC family peroxiredoxin n=1 Tax=Salmonirosea aquatica TaxID=2654236 RepID=A0A7C9BFX7_9BACT|nr:OsmC family peroxiredoxin [Cytophagaceae bacterium SJW1-29]
MKISAHITSSLHQHEATVQTNDSAKELQIPAKSTGYGSSVNGGELLMLALATCFCNDIYREAAKRRMVVTGVEVSVSGEFGAEGEPGTNFSYQASVASDASPAEIEDLIRHTDQVAEIQNTLRKGLAITLTNTSDPT